FVLGEYAVLDGAPAVVAAINRFVEVELELHPSDATTRISAPDLGALAVFPAAKPPAIAGPLRFALAAYHAGIRRSPHLAQAGMTIAITSRLGAAAQPKMGVGSSAAVTTAVLGALLAAGGDNRLAERPSDGLFAAALEAHRAAQHGAGSGADVAAS